MATSADEAKEEMDAADVLFLSKTTAGAEEDENEEKFEDAQEAQDVATPELVAELRRQIDAAGLDLQPIDNEFCDDFCLQRYLRANEGKLKGAFDQLVATIKWRRQAQPWRPCMRCRRNPHAHNMRIVGIDPKGRPVIFTSFSQAAEHDDVNDNIVHCTFTLEIAIKMMKETGSSQWVWISDFDGFGFRDISPRQMIAVKHMLAHYPERLGLVMMVDPPGLFNVTWNIVRPLLNKVTVSKVRFVPMSKRDEIFDEVFDPELSAWMKAEMTENRGPRGVNKEYWTEKEADGSLKPHNPLGTESYRKAPYFCNSYERLFAEVV